MPWHASAGRMASHWEVGLIFSFGMSFSSRRGYICQRCCWLHGDLSGLETPSPVVQRPVFPLDILSCSSATRPAEPSRNGLHGSPALEGVRRATDSKNLWRAGGSRQALALATGLLGAPCHARGSLGSLCQQGNCHVSKYGGLVNS